MTFGYYAGVRRIFDSASEMSNRTRELPESLSAGFTCFSAVMGGTDLNCPVLQSRLSGAGDIVSWRIPSRRTILIAIKAAGNALLQSSQFGQSSQTADT